MRSRRSATVSAPNDRRPEPSHSSSSSRRMAMQQSSSSVGALATALAKAQIDLTNPEKSVIAMIRSKVGAEQIFRYAPLSSGLEILRKTLGQHEIAILQATAIDQAAGVVELTTTLCHSSGSKFGKVKYAASLC